MYYVYHSKYLSGVLITALLMSLTSFASPQKDAVTERIRNRIETAGYPPVIEIQDELIYASQVLPTFYERRGFEPVWSDGNKPLPRVNTLISAITEAHREGLHSKDYHLRKIEAIAKLFADPKNPPRQNRFAYLVDLDLTIGTYIIAANTAELEQLSEEVVHASVVSVG